jgi:class 3 adenylate cyclase/CheY-like chemotaxis protein
VQQPACILVVDDNPANIDIIQMRLETQGYRILTAADGDEAIAQARTHKPDLILLDVMMPKKDGLQVCRELKGDPSLPFMPIILVTAKGDTKDIIAGLESGGDEYLTKPVDTAALLARVRSILRIKDLHDQVQAQACELADWNRTLEARVAAQVQEIDRMSRLKRFLPPQVAELVSAGNEKVLESHRRDITVVFCDLRGFTGFAERSEPEEVMGVLRDYHAALGACVLRHEGTVERYAGDGILILFNDPIECADHTERATRMAIEMRDAIGDLAQRWRAQGHDLGFGVGIARGFATLGQVGFEGRSDYAAIGTVSNLAARLSDQAKAGQILVSQRVATTAERIAEMAFIGELPLKGFARGTPAYELLALRPMSAAAK